MGYYFLSHVFSCLGSATEKMKYHILCDHDGLSIISTAFLDHIGGD